MRESFEDDEVARALNEGFVPVKVDREERPDVDAVYMRACQATTGSGGWPLTAFLTDDQAPFFVGTYFPKERVGGRPGLIELLAAVSEAWKTNRAKLLESGQAVANYLRGGPPQKDEPADQLPRRAYDQLAGAFDPQWGGFGAAPKFPSPVTLLFLMRYFALNGQPEALRMVEKTLEAMAAGGMFDQLGGGFCRYSTDRKWLIPHFEKMLYDNALMIICYTQAYQITGRQDFKTVAERTVRYLLRDMISPEGVFYAAQDADSEGREGAFYALRPEEARRVLGEGLGNRFSRAFGLTDAGNFEEGGSVPNRLDAAEPLDEELIQAAKRMYAYRRARRPLATDDKIMTEWNSLAIGALALASSAFDVPQWLGAAQRALRFIDARMVRAGGLCAYYREGRAVGRGHLNDYASLCLAYLMVYQATFDQQMVSKAEDICQQMIDRFYDDERGDFYLGEAGTDLSFRTKEHDDGAMPSGNSVAAEVLFRLGAITGREKWRTMAERLVGAIAAHASQYPAGACFAQSVALQIAHPLLRAACQSDSAKDIARFSQITGRLYLKNAVCAADPPAEGEPTGYHLCVDEACAFPIRDESRLEEALEQQACLAPEAAR